MTSSTLNFVVSGSGVQECSHSPLRDIQPQSCRPGTEMLGTSACWLHMWPEWFAVPLKCLSNGGRVNETTFGFVSSLLQALRWREEAREKGTQSSCCPPFPPVFFFFFVFALSQFSGPDYLGAWNRLLRQLSVKSYFFYRIEERLSENHSGVFWRWPEVFTVSHPVNAWSGGSASAALVDTLAIS